MPVRDRAGGASAGPDGARASGEAARGESGPPCGLPAPWPGGYHPGAVPSFLRALVLLFALLSLPDPAGAAPLDAVVAVIAAPSGEGRGNRTVITLSELEVETRVTVISRVGSEAAEASIPPETLARSLDWLIAEHLLLFEAEGLAVAAVEPAEVTRAVATFRDRFPDVAGYRRFLETNELTETELGRILRRSLLVSRYLDSRARLAVTVGDEDLRRAYEARDAGAGDESFAEARPRLAREVERAKREEALAAIVADLRARADVRVLYDFAGGDAP